MPDPAPAPAFTRGATSRMLVRLDQRIRDRGPGVALALAVAAIALVGLVDYLTGYEISLSLFYLAPVGIAAWFVGWRAGSAVAVACCVSWYAADLATGHPYSHPVVPFWNAAIRLGFFLVSAALLAEVRALLRRIWELSRTDSLTGLLGRRAFEERLEHELLSAQRHGRSITLAYLDVDDFKRVNDALGHAGGDRVLCTIGTVLRTSLRRTDAAARLGGDEFALLLPATDEQGARHLLQELTRKLEGSFAGDPIRVTCSAGAVTFLDGRVAPHDAIAAADTLMYEIKRQGKGAVGFAVRGPAGQERARG